MIDFPCRCGHRFSLPDDQAGNTIQCPRCHILNDIPSLSDLQSMNPDGTVRLGDVPAPPPEDPVMKMAITFTREHRDDAGHEIDLRPTMQTIRNAGVKDSEPPKPKWDPVTGELVKPLEVVPSDINPATGAAGPIPVAKVVLHYQADVPRSISPGRIPIELCMPGNAFVIFVIFLAQMLLAPVWFLLLCHYGNIVDEIGPDGRDELPRPLRDLSWREDLWGPFYRFFAAIALCYLPVLLVLSIPHPTHRVVAAAVIALLGSLPFPAVLLTMLTAGSLRNLRLDRLLGVIRDCGPAYFVAILLWLLAGGLFIVAVPMATLLIYDSPKLAVFFPGVHLLSVAAMHAFCWYLGLLYRAHYTQFNWILQRHIAKASTFREK